MNQEQKKLLASLVKSAIDSGDLAFSINGKEVALTGWGFNQYADNGKNDDNLNGESGAFLFNLEVK